MRLTGSGLGCEHWPGCQPHQFEPKSYHSYIEFSNRVVAFLTILADARDVRRRVAARASSRRLRWLAFGIFVGTLAQAPLGAITVYYHLNPWLVITHFLLSLAVLTRGRRARRRGSAARRRDRVPAWVAGGGIVVWVSRCAC